MAFEFHKQSWVFTGCQALYDEWMEVKMPKIESLSSEGFQGQPVLGQLSCSAVGRHEKAAEEQRGEPWCPGWCCCYFTSPCLSTRQGPGRVLVFH